MDPEWGGEQGVTAVLSFIYAAAVLFKLQRLHLQNKFCLELSSSLFLPCR